MEVKRKKALKKKIANISETNSSVQMAEKINIEKEVVEAVENNEEKVNAGKKDKNIVSRKKKIIRRVIIGLCCAAAILLVLVGVVYGVFQHYYNKTNYVPDDDITIMAAEQVESLKNDPDDKEGDYYVRQEITNADGEVIGTTYNTVDLDSLTDEERASIEAQVAQELDAAAQEQSKALEMIASGQPYTPPTKEQNDVLVLKQDDIDREYETKEDEQGKLVIVNKDGDKYEVVSKNDDGQIIVVKNDGTDYEVSKDDKGNIVSINKGDQKYEVETDEVGAIVIVPPETKPAETTAPVAASNVYNMLLIGTDLRAGHEGYGKSDSMILVSVNYTKKTINMISFMRDLYADIPGFSVNKLNRAYQYGGGPLLMKTLETNYGIHVDNYAAVDFYALRDIVDSLGGISLNISSEEVEVANEYIRQMCLAIGEKPENYYISGSGQLQLNGMQTVGYCRIRYVGRYDFERTERQRRVLLTIFSILQTKSASEVNIFLNTALPKVTHNISSNTLAGLLMNAPTYLGYQVNTYRVPFDGTYHYSGEILVPDFMYTINELYKIIYY